ncbi:hypothetical protein ACP70R_020816 [Stipagrostis hirtigluma subsp. patula]
MPLIYMKCDPLRNKFPGSMYSHLKDVRITGFEGSTRQLEFLVHVVESAPALQLLMVCAAGSAAPKLADALFRRHVGPKIPPNCSLILVY